VSTLLSEGMDPEADAGKKDCLIILSRQDPVAKGVAALLGQGEATSWHVDGAVVRRLEQGELTLWREPLHIFDSALNGALPPELAQRLRAVVFPSMHRSESGTICLTVHAVGNLTEDTAMGGLPRAVNPVPARLMTAAFLHLREEGMKIGIETTFEGTHHGPFLQYPSFFVEIGSSQAEWENQEVHQAISRILLDLSDEETRGDPIVVAVGGGHYMPRFKDLVRSKSVAFAHLIPSHNLLAVDEVLAKEVVRSSPGVEGVIYARAREKGMSHISQLLPEKSEKDLKAR